MSSNVSAISRASLISSDCGYYTYKNLITDKLPLNSIGTRTIRSLLFRYRSFYIEKIFQEQIRYYKERKKRTFDVSFSNGSYTYNYLYIQRLIRIKRLIILSEQVKLLLYLLPEFVIELMGLHTIHSSKTENLYNSRHCKTIFPA